MKPIHADAGEASFPCIFFIYRDRNTDFQPKPRDREYDGKEDRLEEKPYN
jgi:hypothetical protein